MKSSPYFLQRLMIENGSKIPNVIKRPNSFVGWELVPSYENVWECFYLSPLYAQLIR